MIYREITLKNIILLTVDALRADHISHLGYERKTTPFLDQLAEDAWFGRVTKSSRVQ